MAIRPAIRPAGACVGTIDCRSRLVALPGGVFALVVTRPLPPPSADAEAETLTELALISASVAALGMCLTVAGMLLSLVRMWNLPLDGHYWRPGEVAELAALTGIGGALLLATVRAAATTATARVTHSLRR